MNFSKVVTTFSSIGLGAAVFTLFQGNKMNEQKKKLLEEREYLSTCREAAKVFGDTEFFVRLGSDFLINRNQIEVIDNKMDRPIYRIFGFSRKTPILDSLSKIDRIGFQLAPKYWNDKDSLLACSMGNDIVCQDISVRAYQLACQISNQSPQDFYKQIEPSSYLEHSEEKEKTVAIAKVFDKYTKKIVFIAEQCVNFDVETSMAVKSKVDKVRQLFVISTLNQQLSENIKNDITKVAQDSEDTFKRLMLLEQWSKTSRTKENFKECLSTSIQTMGERNALEVILDQALLLENIQVSYIISQKTK